MKRLGSRASWSVITLLTLGLATPLSAQDRPEHYVLETMESGWWTGASRVLVDWRGDRPVMTGLECLVRHNRYLQDGQPPMEMTITHPVESGDYRFGFLFNLDGGDLTDREVETITVGGRPYRRQNVQSRIIPWFGEYGPDDIILAYGIGRQMFRPDETYPWLPLEFLIPQFFEVEGIKLGISGRFEIEHGEYETRFEELYIDMDGFRETVAWCYQQVNPPGDRDVELPAELRQRLDR